MRVPNPCRKRDLELGLLPAVPAVPRGVQFCRVSPYRCIEYVRVRVCALMYIIKQLWQCLKKQRACNMPGRPFCDKSCNRIGGSCDKPSPRQAYERLQYSTQRPATRVCNRGPTTKVCNREGWGGPRQTRILRHSHVYIYICIHV